MKVAQEDRRIDSMKAQILLQYPATARYRGARSNNTIVYFADSSMNIALG
jgi:hypothetical protein